MDHGPDEPVTFDDIAADLRALRARRGETSFAEISRRISVHRRSQGVPDVAATPPRSTVYNAFRDGRARMDAELVREIALALGESEARADEWHERCTNARRALPIRATAADAGPGTGHHASANHETGGSAKSTLAAPTETSGRTPAPPGPTRTRPLGRWGAAALLLLCVAMNIAGNAIVAELSLGLFLDMIGTAVAAVALGPWYGVVVAVATHGIAIGTNSAAVLPFTLVNIAGALVWGYGIRRFAMGQTFIRYFVLSLIAGTVCTLVAVPIILSLFASGTGHAVDGLALTLQNLGLPLTVAVFAGNLMTSLPDKLMTGFVALSLLLFVHARWRRDGAEFPLLDQLSRLGRSARTSADHHEPARLDGHHATGRDAGEPAPAASDHARRCTQ